MIFNGRNSGKHLNTGVTTIDTVVHMVSVVPSLPVLIVLSVLVCQDMYPSLRRIGITEMVLRGV